MAEKYFHTTALLAVLISLSLSFSTIHNHEALKYNSGDQHQPVEHMISKDSTLCPICGYLFHADFSSGSSVDTVVQVHSVTLYSADLDFDNSTFDCNQKRGPPLNA